MKELSANVFILLRHARALLGSIVLLVLFWHLSIRLGLYFSEWGRVIALPLRPLWLLAHAMFLHQQFSFDVLLTFVAYLVYRHRTDPDASLRICLWALIVTGLFSGLLSEVVLRVLLGPIIQNQFR